MHLLESSTFPRLPSTRLSCIEAFQHVGHSWVKIYEIKNHMKRILLNERLHDTSGPGCIKRPGPVLKVVRSVRRKLKDGCTTSDASERQA